MSKVFNVSDVFGKRLLQGWTPSDRTCLAEECCRIPLLRSPDGHNPVTWFCPSCEGDGSIRDPGPGQPEQQHSSRSPSFASSTHYSRSLTPPTEESHGPGSPTFALPAETEESIRRRQQSDFASAEIGNRLLKGWAMLADECPRSTCHGIPLVRPPKTGRDKDPRKECVVCGTVYVTETETRTQDLDPLAPGTLSVSRQEETTTPSVLVERSSVTAKGKEKAFEGPAIPAVVASVSPAFPVTSSLSRDSNLPLPTLSSHAFSESNSTSGSIVVGSAKALEATLSVLSQRLLLLSGQSILDPVAISQTADAIARTGQAMAVIDTLRHNRD